MAVNWNGVELEDALVVVLPPAEAVAGGGALGTLNPVQFAKVPNLCGVTTDWVGVTDAVVTTEV